MIADRIRSIQAVSGGGGGGSLWDPSMLSPAFWFDAENVTLDGSGKIETVTDLSGNGNHAYQTDSAKRPVIAANAIGGLPAINFNTAATIFRIADSATMRGNQFSYIFVLQQSNWMRRNHFFNSSATNHSLSHRLELGNSFGYYTDGFALSRSGSYQGVLNNVKTTNFFIYTAAANSGSGTTYSQNGLLYPPVSSDILWTDYEDEKEFGGRLNGSFEGQIAEAIKIPRLLNEIDRLKLEGYLAHKYSLTADLPSNHPYKTSAPTTDYPATDYSYSLASLLLNMQGTAGGTTFIDESPNAFTVTRNGNAQLVSDATYGTVASFDGSGDYLTLAGSGGQFAFGTSPFTIEFWLYPLDITTRQGLYSNNINSSSGIGSGPVFAIRGLGQTGKLGVGNVGQADKVDTGQNVLLLNTWQHIALIREGTGTNQTKIYIDGVLQGQGTMSDNYSVSRDAALGRTIYYSEYFNGLIGPARITKGVARYTANFTPPTGLFPAS